MTEVTIIGLDLAKNVFQVHGMRGEPTAKIADLLAAVVPEALPETGVSISFQDSLARTHLSRVCFSLR